MNKKLTQKANCKKVCPEKGFKFRCKFLESFSKESISVKYVI